MKLKVFNTLLFFVFSLPLLSQHRLSGRIADVRDSAAISNSTVYLNEGKQTTVSDTYGRFEFNDLSNGSYTLHIVTGSGHHYKKIDVEVKGADQHVEVFVEERNETLEAVEIADQRINFGFTRMKSVEDMGIYEGKKSEVIIPDQLVANAATNNARQIYSRVAGLNIWENDGAGLQLSIGGRGLDPNRSSNFNVRQNGYDISADALGYPESYYTPPVEALGKIQIVRGAASLQYGTQFGGLINFQMKKPVPDQKIELVARQTVGSFGFYNAFTSAGGTVKKLSYYTFYQYKQGNGWRPNSDFDNHTFFANVNYAFTDRTSIGIDITQMGYLAHQPGGLTDEMFKKDARQSNRERNWFKVNWNLYAVHFNHNFSANSEINLRLFGLSAYRYSLGFRPNRVATMDDNSERDLIKGNFENWGGELRYLKRYRVANMPSVFLIGTRYYHGFNHSTQGLGSTGKDADFNYVNPDEYITYDYRFPNRNVSAFAENIINVTDQLSFTPGVRFEYINTKSDGYYGNIFRDLAGNVIEITKTTEARNNGRQFVLAGLGISYKPVPHVNVYSNLSQNYRSITFSDMNISNPSLRIDPNLADERGYSFDLGVRSDQTTLVNYDVSVFFLNYNNRIGEVQFSDENDRVLRRRGNIGQAQIMGIESYGEVDIIGVLNPAHDTWSGVMFGNVALLQSKYTRSELTGVKGNEVEFVPKLNLKAGLRAGYKNAKVSFQFTHLSDQYSEARNSRDSDPSAVIGVIPAYTIMDISASYQWKVLKLEGSVNNVANEIYFTRRATGYPGPGILPSDGRSFFITLQVKI